MLTPLDIEEKSKTKEESQTLLDTDSEDKDPFIPSERFLFLFRKEWSNLFRKFDDSLISVVQYIHIKKAGQNLFLQKGLGYPFWILGEILTYITQVEYGPSLCVLAIIAGYDYIGRWLLIATVSTALVAQIPKRFMFRKRPYMEKRALELEREASSSFPSRSAVCGILYSFAIMYAYNYKMQYIDNTPDQVFSTFSMILLTFVGGIITSIARIYMGAHYPSDCIVGMVLGAVLVSSSFLVSLLPNLFGCPSCYQQACYPEKGPQVMTTEDFELQNVDSALIAIAVVGLIQITSSLSPVRFWDKSAPIFGTFAACLAAGIILACPKDGSKGLVASQELSTSGYITALVMMQINLILITTTTKLYRKMKNLSWQKSLLWNMGVFTLFSFIFLVAIIKTRLYVTSPNE